MYGIAAMWLVFEISGSTFYTGVAGFLVQLPTVFQFLVGPLVDRWSLRRILIVTQVLQGLCVLLVPLAHAAGYLSVWLVILIMPLLTFLSQFVYPAQSAALPRLLDDEQLVRANSLFSFAGKGLNMTFKAASGALIAVIGAVSLYVVDAVTFGIATLLFLGVTVPRESVDETETETDRAETAKRRELLRTKVDTYFSRLSEGISYLRGSVVLKISLSSVIVNFAYGVDVAVFPAFASVRGGPEVYGLLSAAMAAGGLIGAAVTSFVEGQPFGRIMIVSFATSGVLWFGAVTVGSLPATVALFTLTFIPVAIGNVLLRSMVQSAVDNDMLGRVTSVTSSLSTVMTPVGMLVGGAAADVFGPITIMASLSLAFVSISVFFLVRPEMRSLPSVSRVDADRLDVNRTP